MQNLAICRLVIYLKKLAQNSHSLLLDLRFRANIFDFVEGLPSPFQFLVHRQQILHPGILPCVLPHQEDNVFDLNAPGPSNLHRPVGHFGNEFNDQILQQIHTLRVGILIIPETIHHASQLFAEQTFPPGSGLDLDLSQVVLVKLVGGQIGFLT